MLGKVQTSLTLHSLIANIQLYRAANNSLAELRAQHQYRAAYNGAAELRA